jgi:hypothetical protein
MAATVTVNRLTGVAAATKNNITGANTRANAEDAHSTSGTSNPVRVPTSGSNYSYWVSTRLEVTVAPTGTINNLKWWSSGSVGTGIGIVGMNATSYVQATGTPGVTGIVLSTGNHAGLTATPLDVFTNFTSGSPKSLGGSITASTGLFGDYFVYQFTVNNTASPGATSQPTFTWQYDET